VTLLLDNNPDMSLFKSTLFYNRRMRSQGLSIYSKLLPTGAPSLNLKMIDNRVQTNIVYHQQKTSHIVTNALFIDILVFVNIYFTVVFLKIFKK
jgi:hypothetical protein